MESMIVAKGQPKTRDIESCEYNDATHKWDVTYKGGKKYSYSYDNIEVLKNPRAVDTGNALFYYENRLVSFNSLMYEFSDKGGRKYYRFIHDNKHVEEFASDQLRIEQSCITEKNSNILEYLKEIATINPLTGEEGEKLLEKQYAQIGLISDKTALADYICSRNQRCNEQDQIPLIFPFGCNKSQYEAVSNALNNKVSVIQGPPGTGKTQTILNIISNILVRGKTVQVVSNNNSAIENVSEKLYAYNISFVSAFLGKMENKDDFIYSQTGEYPDFKGWNYGSDKNALSETVYTLSEKAHKNFEYNEELALLKQEKARLETEYKYFQENTIVRIEKKHDIRIKDRVDSKDILRLLDEWKDKIETERIGIFFKIKLFFKYGIKYQEIRPEKLGVFFDFLYDTYYLRRRREIDKRIDFISKEISKDSGTIEQLSMYSMMYLKNHLAEVYSDRKSRTVFDIDDLWKHGDAVLKEYPVILSTTFSAKNSLGSRLMPVTYDYVIVDEASQVDLATGALALYSAKNAVIVGDLQQLPNVLTNEDRMLAESIFERYSVPKNYAFTNSFLKSVLLTIKDAPAVMLREHYRCHPKIIEYCNQKFYQGHLIIMTQDNNEKDVIKAFTSLEGNHARGHHNQRQIDIIKNEILDGIDCPLEDIGIIAPYREQVAELRNTLPDDIKIDTVHKFQGREENTIIISTVDNVANDFSDDPNLINVAVSRAKKKLYVVTSGNETSGNIHDLVEYIRYNNFEVKKSSINSIFDYLYSQYTDLLQEKMKGKKRISEFDSENLMYALLQDVITEYNYPELEVLCHMSLRNIISDVSLMNEEEKKYALHPCTHIDFSLVNRVTKKLILAIEVDGYAFHNKETRQAERDLLKNHIFEIYNIPYLRFSTTGSNEKEILINKLNSLMSVSSETVNDKQITEKYRYYCAECNKHFKIKGSGKKVKCPVCGCTLYDLGVTDSEYDSLDKVEKAAIIRHRVQRN